MGHGPRIGACQEECDNPSGPPRTPDDPEGTEIVGVVSLDGVPVPDVVVTHRGEERTTRSNGTYRYVVPGVTESFDTCITIGPPFAHSEPWCGSIRARRLNVVDWRFERDGPRVDIREPFGSRIEPTGVRFSASAAASIEAHGTPPAPIVRWTSSLDGHLGSSESPIVVDLTPGLHFVTAHVANPLGEAAADVEDYWARDPNNVGPTVTITDPADASVFETTDTIIFRGTAIDPDDGAVPDSAFEWSIAELLDRLGNPITATLPEGDHRVDLRVRDSGYEPGYASVWITVQSAANAPPIAEITSPPDGSTFTTNEFVFFVGSATDPEDGALTGPSLSWTSSVEGPLGNGGSLTRPLVAGQHTITLTAMDSEGATGETSVLIDVIPPGTGATIQGTVTVGGDGLPGIPVVLSGAASDTTSTNFGGGYSFTDLGPGEYTITITPPPGAPLPTTQSVTVAAGQTVTVNFVG